MIFFVFVVLGLVVRLAGTSLITLLKVIKDEITLAFSTASSETVLPRLIEKMEKFGCGRAVTSFVIPTGYSFNLDGAVIYQSIATIFVAQLYRVDLSFGEQLGIVAVLAVASKGMAGVAGAALVVLLTTLGSVGLPPEGLAFVVGIDRILDMGRTTVNIIGNSIAAVVVSKWEGDYDPNRAKEYLDSLEEEPEAAVAGAATAASDSSDDTT